MKYLLVLLLSVFTFGCDEAPTSDQIANKQQEAL